MRDLTDPVVTWSDEQRETFLRQVVDDRFAALWHLAATSGIGLVELARTRRQQVDITAGTFRTRGSHQSRSRPDQTDPAVMLEPRTLEMVRQHVIAWERDRLSTYPGATHLFLRTDGRRVAVDDVVVMFQVHCLRAGVPIVDPAARRAPAHAAEGRRGTAARGYAARSVSATHLLPHLWGV